VAEQIEPSFFALKQDDLERAFGLNFMGSLLATQVFARGMVERRRGVIVNISSMCAFAPLTRVVAYSAAKAALSNFTQWLAVHLAPVDIRVNALAPGFLLTNQNYSLLIDQPSGQLTPRGQAIITHTPLRRFGLAPELIGTLVWLISDASKFVTGSVIPIDGGFAAFSGV
jgi:NAD(P)-dependent dehydrogenase (short-subunit alcohol dehydrogenase family)